MRIAIIDKYISEKEVFSLTGKNVHPIAITGNGDECGKLIDNAPLLSHGTVCAALLTEFVLDSDYIAISVAPNKNDDFVVQNICYALSWCLNNPTDYICISAGTTNWRASQPMKSLTKRLSESGTKIVAAVSPDSALTFPACYPWVIGVQYEEDCRSINWVSSSSLGYDAVVGNFDSNVLNNLSQQDDFFKTRSSSMAVPYFVGHLMRHEIFPFYPKDCFCMTDSKLQEYIQKIPIVRVMSKEIDVLVNLMREFQENEYMAALITIGIDTDWSKLIVNAYDYFSFYSAVIALKNASIILVDSRCTFFSGKIGFDYSIDLREISTILAYNSIISKFK